MTQQLQAAPTDGEQVTYVAAPPVTSQIAIDPMAPWAGWPEPTIRNTNISKLRVATHDGQLELQREVDDDDEIDIIGRVTSDSFQQLGWHTGFPAEFVAKLPVELQAQIANDRIASVAPKDFTVVEEEGKFTNLAPNWRGLIPYSHTAQFVSDMLKDVYGDEVRVDQAQRNGKMRVRIMTPLQQPVTRKVGDVLEAGVDIEQCYGITINVSTYARRLVCLNGATTTGEEFKWTQRSAGSIEHQLAWLRQGVQSAMAQFETIAGKARVMAETGFRGNPVDVLREHARAMRLPARFVPPLIEAFNQEPGNTEWDLLNAFTRLATHGSLPDRYSRSIMRASGDWISDFDMVNCRMPRPMAVAVGAEILETSGA